MTRKIEFTKGNWEKYFDYAYTERFPFAPTFIQEEECIANGRNGKMADGFDYTTIMTKERFTSGTKIKLECSFEKYGAPLITLTDTLRKDEYGNLKYGVSQEVVLWKNGINVWDFFIEEGKLKWNLVMSSLFHPEEGKIHELCVELKEKCIRIVAGDNDLSLRMDYLPPEVYIGITGCENINRFYSLEIETYN